MDNRMLCFDADAWNEAGGNVGDKNQFFKEVEIVGPPRISRDYGVLIATVRWPDGRVTAGHFVDMMKDLTT